MPISRQFDSGWVSRWHPPQVMGPVSCSFSRMSKWQPVQKVW